MLRTYLTPDSEIVRALEIQGLPAFFFFSQGHLFRDLARAFYLRTGQPVHRIKPVEIVNDLLLEVQPVGATMRSDEDIDDFLNDADDADGELPPVRVLLKWPADGDPGAERLSSFLRHWSQIFRVAVSPPAMMAKALANMSLPGNTTAVLLHKDGTKQDYSSDLGLAGLPGWLLQHCTQMDSIFDPKTYLTYLKLMPAIGVVMLMVDEQKLPPTMEEGSPRAVFLAVAKQFRGRINAVTLLRPPGEGGKDRQAKQRYAFGIKKESGPVVGIINGGRKYAMQEAFSHNAVHNFIQSYLAGKLTESIASAAELNSATAHNELLNKTMPSVKIMSALGLRRGLQANHGLLVWFCVPYLERCQDGGSKFARIATALLEHGTRDSALAGMEIATFDVGENDLPHRFNASGVRVWGNMNIPPEFASLPMTGYHQWKYFMVPSLYFFPKRNIDGTSPTGGAPRRPIRYEGGLVYNKIKDFLLKSSNLAPGPGKTEL